MVFGRLLEDNVFEDRVFEKFIRVRAQETVEEKGRRNWGGSMSCDSFDRGRPGDENLILHRACLRSPWSSKSG